MIRVDHVTKRYGNTTVVNDVCLEIPDGGVTSLIGPNGAGKSTLLGMIARLDKPCTGVITLNGQDVHQTKSRDLATQLAILRQENHINVRLTVRELVLLGRYPHCGGRPRPNDIAIADEMIDHLDLGAYANRDINQLSGGQRQRGFVAMALAQQTTHLLLDEPLNNLDLRHSRQMMQLIRTITDDLGRSVIVVIHDINTAARYSDRIVAMKDGQIIANGTPTEVVTSDTLTSVFDTPVAVTEVDGKPLALTY